MSFVFNDTNECKINELLKAYPAKEALTLPMLWMAQYQEGWISPDAIRTIAQRLDLSPSHLFGIATFYTMFKLSPSGTYTIEVCKTLSCDLCGKDDLLRYLRKNWNLVPGQTSDDGRFTLRQVECMGACGGAPMIALNEIYHENMTVDSLDSLLKSLA